MYHPQFLLEQSSKQKLLFLEEVKIKGDQIEEIFTESMTVGSKMKHLSMIGMNNYLSEVESWYKPENIQMPDNQIAVDAFNSILEVDSKVLTKALINQESFVLDLGSGGDYDECRFIYPQLVAFLW